MRLGFEWPWALSERCPEVGATPGDDRGAGRCGDRSPGLLGPNTTNEEPVIQRQRNRTVDIRRHRSANDLNCSARVRDSGVASNESRSVGRVEIRMKSVTEFGKHFLPILDSISELQCSLRSIKNSHNRSD
jgi:hypothetical protein